MTAKKFNLHQPATAHMRLTSAGGAR